MKCDSKTIFCIGLVLKLQNFLLLQFRSYTVGNNIQVGVEI